MTAKKSAQLPGMLGLLVLFLLSAGCQGTHPPLIDARGDKVMLVPLGEERRRMDADPFESELGKLITEQATAMIFSAFQDTGKKPSEKVVVVNALPAREFLPFDEVYPGRIREGTGADWLVYGTITEYRTQGHRDVNMLQGTLKFKLTVVNLKTGQLIPLEREAQFPPPHERYALMETGASPFEYSQRDIEQRLIALAAQEIAWLFIERPKKRK